MTTTVLVILYVTAGYLAPPLLDRAGWPRRCPRVGVFAWLAAAITCALAALLSVATLALPVAVAGHGLADWWNDCLEQWRHYYGDASPVGVAAASGATALLVGRLVQSALSHHRQVVNVRRRHLAGLALLGCRGQGGVVVLPHPVPAAYCVPGRPGQVVMTDGAVRALGADQVAAVIAHERAHLSGRHALIIGATAVLDRALGRLAPVFGRAARETRSLVEMIADDAAVTRCPAPRVVEALITLADGATPGAALAASGPLLVPRIRRLTDRPRPMPAMTRWAALVGLGAGAVMPVAIVMLPLAAAVIAATCAHPSH